MARRSNISHVLHGRLRRGCVTKSAAYGEAGLGKQSMRQSVVHQSSLPQFARSEQLACAASCDRDCV